MTSANSRRGATLVELIVGIVLMSSVTTLAVSHIVRHLRSVNAISAALDLNGRLRDGADILAADLRGISPRGDSLSIESDTAVQFYSAIGTSTLCATPTPNTLILPPDSLPSGRVLSSWVAEPEPGDDVLVFEDTTASGISGWQRASVQAVARVATASACPASAGLLLPGDVLGTARALEVLVAPNVTLRSPRGAPVRLVRRVRYSVYRGGDRKWYLGYRRCPGVCASIQPLSGPYESGSGFPFSFRYVTSAGAPVSTSGAFTDIARIQLVPRAAFATPFQLPGMSAAMLHDSLNSTVSLRNRW